MDFFININGIIEYLGGKFIASDNNDNTYYSLDGINWFKVNGMNSSIHLYKLFYINGIYMAESNFIYYSLDGINWNISNITNNNQSGGNINLIGFKDNTYYIYKIDFYLVNIPFILNNLFDLNISINGIINGLLQ